MTTYPQGPETGVVYTLTGPDGDVAVFNDPTDPDYVGSLTDLTGLDAPEVRESAYDLVEADGGYHGNFFYGRRPVTLSGTIIASSPADRNAKMSKLRRASAALRGDAILEWTPTGGIPSFLSLRLQQPQRFSGGFVKDYFLAMVAANPRIQSSTLHQLTSIAHNTPTNVDNQGDSPNYPARIKINGPFTGMILYNLTLGVGPPYVVYTGTIAAGDGIEFDFLNKTVVNEAGSSQYDKISFGATEWWELQPGVNSIKHGALAGATAATVMDIDWRDAWI